jgi:hypothetical protein
MSSTKKNKKAYSLFSKIKSSKSQTYKLSTKKSNNFDKHFYPFWYKKIPFPRYKKIEDLVKQETWDLHLNYAKKFYSINKSSENNILKKNTYLFHGSSVIDPVNNLKFNNTPFFFGLDAFISLWYLTEIKKKQVSKIRDFVNAIIRYFNRASNAIKDNEKMIKSGHYTDKKLKENIDSFKEDIQNVEEGFKEFKKCFSDYFKKIMYIEHDLNYNSIFDIQEDINKYENKYYFLHVYKTIENIEYKYLEDILDENPHDFKECTKQACLHPQFGYHINELEPPVELSMEFTIPANKIRGNIKLEKVYLVDVNILMQNYTKDFNNFNPLTSIVCEINNIF